MRTRTAATATPQASPHELAANAFLEHHKDKYAPNGLLIALDEFLAERKHTFTPSSALAPTHLVKQFLEEQNTPSVSDETVRFLSTLHAWDSLNTIITSSGNPHTDPSSTWLDPTLSERLPPGSTYISMPLRFMKTDFIGVFITPDTLPDGTTRQLTIILLGAKPVTLSLALGVTLEEAAAATVLDQHFKYGLFQRRRNVIIGITQVLGQITNVLHTFASSSTHTVNPTSNDIRERAISLTSLIHDVKTNKSTAQLRFAIHEQREGSLKLGETWPSNVYTPTYILTRALLNRRDHNQLAQAHLLTGVHVIEMGGQVVFANTPFEQLPNQLTSLHTLPSTLAKNMREPSIYICSPDSMGTINNGFIVRPDVNEEGDYSFIITFHTRSRQSVQVPLDVHVENAIQSITEQFGAMQTTNLPCNPDKLRQYLFGLLTALSRYLGSPTQPCQQTHAQIQEAQTLQGTP